MSTTSQRWSNFKTRMSMPMHDRTTLLAPSHPST
jgi:hypothetical protein